MEMNICELCCLSKKSEKINNLIISAVFKNIGRRINRWQNICKNCISINMKWYNYMKLIKENRIGESREPNFSNATADAQQSNSDIGDVYEMFRKRLKKNFSCMNDVNENVEREEIEKDNEKPKKKKDKKTRENVDENSSASSTYSEQTSENLRAITSDVINDLDDSVIIISEDTSQPSNDEIEQQNSSFTCGSCLVTCANKTAFNDHLKSVDHLDLTKDDEKNEENLYTCCRCEKQFKKINLSRHMRKCLQLSQERICSICLEILGNMAELQIHRATHKKYTCQICSVSFSTVRALKAHKRGEHSNIASKLKLKIIPQSLSCPICDKEYLKQAYLNYHISKFHKYRCEMCMIAFTKSSSLTRHLRTHNKNNADVTTTMIKCEYCGGRYQNKQCLDVHTCSGNPRYTCKRCKARFSSVLCYHKHKDRCGRHKSVPMTHQQLSSQNCGNVVTKIQKTTTKGVGGKQRAMVKKSVKSKTVKKVDGNASKKCVKKMSKKTIENITKPTNEDMEFLETTKNRLEAIKRVYDEESKKRGYKSKSTGRETTRKEAAFEKSVYKKPQKQLSREKVKRIDKCDNCKNIFTSQDLIRHLPLCIRFEIITDHDDTYRKCERCSMLFSSLPEIHEHSLKCKYKPPPERQEIRTIDEDQSSSDQYSKSKHKPASPRHDVRVVNRDKCGSDHYSKSSYKPPSERWDREVVKGDHHVKSKSTSRINENSEIILTIEHQKKNTSSTFRHDTRTNDGPASKYAKYTSSRNIVERRNKRGPFSSNVNNNKGKSYGNHYHKNSYTSPYWKENRN